MKGGRWPKIIFNWDLSLKTEGWSDQVQHILSYIQYDIDLGSLETVDLDATKSALKRINQIKCLTEASTKSKLRTF